MNSDNRALLRLFLEFLFRRRSPALLIMRLGAGLIAAALGAGFVFNVAVPVAGGSVNFGFNTGDGLPLTLIFSVVALGAVLVVVGLLFELWRYRDEQIRLNRKVVLAIEARGLREGVGRPLSDSVPEHLEGRRQQFLLDLRQSVEDGVVVSPEAVLRRLRSLNQEVARLVEGRDRADVSLVYGGMAPVPFTFLSGLLLDDEDRITVMDWDRNDKRWRELDENDDGKRFKVSGLDEASGNEVVVAVSTSLYSVLDSNLAMVFPELSVVRLDLDGASQDAHWSERKQIDLAAEFLRVVGQLDAKGVRHIHLVISVQNSVAFRLGAVYDKKNLPPVSVYQFEFGSTPPYPWSVSMPVAGKSDPEVIFTSQQAVT